jgi:hypothetical protein
MSETQIIAITDSDYQGRQRRVNLGQRILRPLRRGSHPVSDSQDRAVLPESIRYAMTYRGAQLSGAQVESLHRARLPRPAFYLAMKAADRYDTVQSEMLRRLAGVQFDYDQLSIDVIRLGTAVLNGQSGGNAKTVAGEKLGQFSRHGFMGDVKAFSRALTLALADKPDAPLFMVANYPYIALDELAEHSLGRGNQLGIINPDRLSQTEMPIGFMMEDQASDFTVRPLEHDFEMPPGAVIFDDVIREGKTRDTVMAWAAGAVISPTFVAAVQVPTGADSF